jgi:amino acid transporter
MKRRITEKINLHAGWAMAVGGMIGGGIYTLAGVILGTAGPLAWLSLALGCILALITVRSYFCLTLQIKQEGVPVTFLVEKGRPRLATLFSWWLLLVYVLATAVYCFTFGHYLGRALGFSDGTIALLTVGLVAVLVTVNLLGVKEPAKVQIAAVWIELLILAGLALAGFWHWNPQNLARGVPHGSVGGVMTGMAATFIAFEGFEMVAYDYRELGAPRRILGKGLAAAVLAVGAAYALVTVGAASLVGADVLVAQKENALAAAGAKVAGTAGLIIVTIAACSSAASAVNATLFSVSRLARSAAEDKLLPSIFARCNRKQCPHFAIIALGVVASALASVSSLEMLVESASLAFLLLFCFVNTLAFFQCQRLKWLALIGSISTAGAAVIVGRTLALTHPWVLSGFLGVCILFAAVYLAMRLRRKTAN